MHIVSGNQLRLLRSMGRQAYSNLPPPVGNLVSAQMIAGPHRVSGICLSGLFMNRARGIKEPSALCGVHWDAVSCAALLPQGELCRSFSGGKQKCGETAKEKRMRRMLKKLNYVAEGDAPHKENTRDWQPQEHQQTRRGREEKDRGSFDSKNTEAEAEAALEAAQQQMNGHLGDLVSRLKDLDVSRPKISTFEDIQVQVAGGNKRLSDLAQVQIKGSSVVILTLFSEQHLSKVISALRRTDENWRIVEDGPVTVRVQLPKMTEDLRNSFIAQAKAATEECKVQIRRVRQDTRSKHRSLFKDSRLSEGTRKNEDQQLQKITDDAIKRAAQFLADKLRHLAAASC